VAMSQRVAPKITRQVTSVDLEHGAASSSFSSPATSFCLCAGRRRIWAGRAAGATLTFVSGYVNMCTLIRFGTVGGPMTGNTIRFGGALGLEDWDGAAAAGIMICGFYVGGVAMLALVELSQTRVPLLALFGPSLLAGGSLLLSDGLAQSFALQPMERLRLVTSLSAFSLGGQNVISGRAPCLGANTTFMTGTVKRISEGTWALMCGELKGKEADTFKLLLTLWTCTMLGAVIGSHAASAERGVLLAWPLLPAVCLQALTIFLIRWRDPEKPTNTTRKRLDTVTPTPSRDVSPVRPRPPVNGTAMATVRAPDFERDADSKAPSPARLQPKGKSADGGRHVGFNSSVVPTPSTAELESPNMQRVAASLTVEHSRVDAPRPSHDSDDVAREPEPVPTMHIS